MASRILSFVSCTLYFFILCTLTIIGLTSVIVGCVGLGLYIPTLINHNAHKRNLCYIVEHEYDTCQRQNTHTCYSVMWSVEYTVSNETTESYIFSTITRTYDTSVEALNQLKIYVDYNNYTCYYQTTRLLDVTWDKPASPKPFFIMTIVGFSLTGIFLIIIVSIAIYRCRKK